MCPCGLLGLVALVVDRTLRKVGSGVDEGCGESRGSVDGRGESSGIDGSSAG